ncbi:hypothetical protein J3A83DRAFT_4186541 [Scleroderma citrinum]
MADVEMKKGCDETRVAWWHSDVNKLKVSYDIACQWYKKLHQWMDNMPPSLQLNLCDQNIMFLWLFSSNWMKGMDQTDGKEPEHRWANINIAILSINNMGLGHCDWNWKKLIGLGPSILQKQVKEWKSDPSKPNPFKVKSDGITHAHLQLAKDEVKLSADITPSILISTGIDPEEQQWWLYKATKLGPCTTDT